MVNFKFITALLFSFLFFSTSWGQEYLLNGGFEQGIAKWKGYCDAAGTRPVDGTGSPNANMAVTASTTNPLIEKSSGILTKDANNRQGCGISSDFTIDASQKSKVLQIELTTLVNSGTFAAGSSSTDSDVIVYIYDITNSKLIEPTSIKILSNSSTLSEKLVTNFQTSPDSTSYRLILHAATTSASAYALKVEASVKPSRYVYGTPISDWTPFTSTVTNFTVSAQQSLWRRVGDSMQIRFFFNLNSAVSSTVRFNMPSGYSIDALKMDYTANDGNVGYATANRTAANNYIGHVQPGNTSGGFRIITNGGNEWTSAIPITWQSGDRISAFVEVPIVGWASSTQVSDGYDSRKIIFEARTNPGSIATSAATYVTLTWSAVNVDHVGGWNGTDTYTVKTSDCYDIQVLANQNSPAAAYIDVAYRIDGGSEVLIGRGLGSGSAGGVSTGTATVCLNAGQTVQARAQTEGTQGIGSLRRFTIKRSGGGSPTMNMTEKVAFMAEGASSASLGSNTVIPFNTPSEDTHSCWNSTNKDCAVPYAGTYKVTCAARATFAGASVNQYFNVLIQVDTVTKREFVKYLENTGVAALSVITSYQVRLNAGQKIRCLGDTNLTAGTLTTSGTHTYMEIALVK